MGDSIDPLARSFERHLRAENKAERTVHTYLEALGQLAQTSEPRGGRALSTPPPRISKRSSVDCSSAASRARPRTGTGASRLLPLAGGRGRGPVDPMVKLETPAVSA